MCIRDSDYTYEALKLFLLGAISRAFQPGCKFEIMLCLVGGQGAGKSTFFLSLIHICCYDNTSLYFEIITFRFHDERQINFRRDIDAGYRDYNDCICSDYNLFVL